jgi:hypothetical protein
MSTSISSFAAAATSGWSLRPSRASRSRSPKLASPRAACSSDRRARIFATSARTERSLASRSFASRSVAASSRALPRLFCAESSSLSSNRSPSATTAAALRLSFFCVNSVSRAVSASGPSAGSSGGAAESWAPSARAACAICARGEALARSVAAASLAYRSRAAPRWSLARSDVTSRPSSSTRLKNGRMSSRARKKPPHALASAWAASRSLGSPSSAPASTSSITPSASASASDSSRTCSEGLRPSPYAWRRRRSAASPCKVSTRASWRLASARPARAASSAGLGGDSSSARRAAISAWKGALGEPSAIALSERSMRARISSAAARENVVATMRSTASGGHASLRLERPIDVRPSVSMT